LSVCWGAVAMQGAVAGLSFSEASPELLLSCGVDGTTKCTDRRTQKVGQQDVAQAAAAAM
jgi:hypothetical protein